MKKYTIAQNEKELYNNLKSIGKYHSNNKTYKSILKRLVVRVYYAIVLKGFYNRYNYNKGLCKLYSDEIDLYHLVNDSTKKDLQVDKAFLNKKMDHRLSVVLPIFISILASLIYGVIFSYYLKSFFTWIKTNLLNLWEQESQNYESIFDLIYDNKSPFLFLGVLVLSELITLSWLLIQLVYIISYCMDGHDVNRAIAYKYELNRLEEFITCDEYFALLEKLNILSSDFMQCINQLVYNSIIINGPMSVEDFEKEIEGKFMTNSKINSQINNDMLKICDKKIIIKSIIFRAILKNRYCEYSKWEFSKGMLSIKENVS